MIAAKSRCISRAVVLFAAAVSAGCSRAPSFDIFGSFFPAWLVCLAAGVILTGAAHWLLLRARVPLAIPGLAYPSLTAVITFALWLLFFR
jgi:hypothetical protein